MTKFTIQLVSNLSPAENEQAAKVDYTGYYLIITFNQRIYSNVVFGRIRVDFEEDGTGSVELPKQEDLIDNEIHLEAYSASGSNVRKRFTRTVSSIYKDKDKIIQIHISPNTGENLQLQLSQSYIVNGRIIEIDNYENLSDVRIVFMGSDSDKPTLEDSIILNTTKTFKEGYFRVNIPNTDSYKYYYAIVENSEKDYYSLRVENDKVAERQIIPVVLKQKEQEGVEVDSESKKDDCGCKKNVTRVPNERDFGSVEGEFSEDISGKCVNFTIPNRTIDEFSFYHVVRTTEPEIKSVTVSSSELLKIYEQISKTIEPIIPRFIERRMNLRANIVNKDSFLSIIKNDKLQVSFQPSTLSSTEMSRTVANNDIGEMTGIVANEVTTETKKVIDDDDIDEVEKTIVNENIMNVKRTVANKSITAVKEIVANEVTKEIQKNIVVDDIDEVTKTIVNEGVAEAKKTIANEDIPVKSTIINESVKRLDRTRIEDFIQLIDDTVNFDLSFISTSEAIKAEFEKIKKCIQEEELALETLINELKLCFEGLRYDLNSVGRLQEISALLPKIEAIKLRITKYIEKCRVCKDFYNNELNKKILTSESINYIKELDDTIYQFQNFSNTIHTSLNQLIQKYIINHPGRKSVSVEHEIDWDSTPTIYHNTTISHGHLLHFKQIWKNDGYSVGRVLQSIPLMPGQQKNIAVFEWNRLDISSRVEEQTNTEHLSSQQSRDRDVSEVMNSAFSENIRASSQAKSKASGWSIGASIGFPVGPVMVGVSGGYSSSNSSASSQSSQDASRNLSANSLNKLRDNIQQSATSLRSQRSTVIQTVSQNESFSVTTEVIANYNHCHALTMQYFEILRHIVIEQKLVDVQECLFVPLPMSVFDLDKILRWKNTLSGILLERDLSEGLNAVDRIINKYAFVDFPTGRYCDDSIQYIEGEMTIAFSFTRPSDDIDAAGKENYQILENKLNLNPFFRFGGIRDLILNNYKQILITQQRERQAVFEYEVVPKIVEGLIDCLKVEKQGGGVLPNFDFTPIDSYENKRISGWEELFIYAKQGRINEISARGKPLKIRFRTYDTIGVKRSDLTQLSISFDLSKLGVTATAIPNDCKIILHSFVAKYATDHYEGMLVANYNVKDDIKLFNNSDKATVRTPLSRAEKRNPKDEDKVLAAKLVSHLNEYLEFYHKQIWLSMDPNRLFSLVDGFIAPHSGGRSVASVCENTIIGVVGNNLVLKVAPGYKLDPTYSNTDGCTLLEHYQPTTPPDPFRICFPTNGIYAEAIMGACNSCEKMDDTRYWKWEEHPIPNKPTEINPINTDSRYFAPGDLQTKDLASPMINIQNTPEAPAPTGLSGVFELLGKNGIFGDFTGLSGNQDIVKHALTENAKTLEKTQANAVEGMKLAKQIYDSREANKDVQRKVEQIDKAFPLNGSEQDKQQNSELKKQLFNKQLGIDDQKPTQSLNDKIRTINDVFKDRPKEAGKLIEELIKKEYGLENTSSDEPTTEKKNDDNEGINEVNEIAYNILFNTI